MLVCWSVGVLEALETLEALVAKAVKVGNQANDGRQASQGRYDGLFLYQNENVLVCVGGWVTFFLNELECVCWNVGVCLSIGVL